MLDREDTDEPHKVGLGVLFPKFLANLTVFSASFFPGLRRKKGAPDSLNIFNFVQLKSTCCGPLGPCPLQYQTELHHRPERGFSLLRRGRPGVGNMRGMDAVLGLVC